MTLRNQFSFLGIKKIDSSLVFISCALVVYPATVLLVPKINGLIFGLFSLFGLFTLFKYRGKYTKPDRSETLFYFSVGVFFLATLLITLNAGFVYKVFGKHIHVLLVIPVYIYLCHVGVRLVFVWYGFFAGSIIAAGIAIYDVGITDTSAYWGNGGLRAMGITHPIIFGDLALAMGCMSIAGYGWFKHRGKLQASLPAIAMICGLFASVLSGSRGSWVALPFLIVVFFWYINAHFSIKQKVATATMVALTLCALYLIPQTKVSFHIDKTVNSIQQYSENDAQSRKRATSMGLRFEMWQVRKRATSVGTRFEMWRAAWKMYLDKSAGGTIGNRLSSRLIRVCVTGRLHHLITPTANILLRLQAVEQWALLP